MTKKWTTLAVGEHTRERLYWMKTPDMSYEQLIINMADTYEGER